MNTMIIDETDCFLCQKPNCILKCAQPDCNIYYCSESHYLAHRAKIKRIAEPKRVSRNKSPSASTPSSGSDNSNDNELQNTCDNEEETFLCMPYRVQNSEKTGRHFVATRDINALELILLDPPVVVGPSGNSNPGCIICLKQCTGDVR